MSAAVVVPATVVGVKKDDPFAADPVVAHAVGVVQAVPISASSHGAVVATPWVQLMQRDTLYEGITMKQTTRYWYASTAS